MSREACEKIDVNFWNNFTKLMKNRPLMTVFDFVTTMKKGKQISVFKSFFFRNPQEKKQYYLFI